MSSAIIPADNIPEEFAVRIKELISLMDEVQTAGLSETSAADFAFFEEYFHVNPWFTPDYIRKSLNLIYSGLTPGIYPGIINRAGNRGKTIAIILNPGAPFEGVGEVLFTALSGFNCLVKVPDDSRALFERFFSLVCNPSDIYDRITFSSERLPPFDGVIGINTFEKPAAISYIVKRPNLLISQKGNAVTLSGEESSEQLEHLAGEICNFYGRSNFSVKKLNVPAGYDFSLLFKFLELFNKNAINHRYFNHYEYQKAIMLIGNIKHLDNGFILLTNDLNQTGKTGVVTYQEYERVEDLNTVTYPLKNAIKGSLSAGIQGFTNGMVLSEKRFFYNSERIGGFLSGM